MMAAAAVPGGAAAPNTIDAAAVQDHCVQAASAALRAVIALRSAGRHPNNLGEIPALCREILNIERPMHQEQQEDEAEQQTEPPGLLGGGGDLSLLPADVLRQRVLPLLLELRRGSANQRLTALADVVRLSSADRGLRALVHSLALPQVDFALGCLKSDVSVTFPEAAKQLHGVLALRREDENAELVLRWTIEDDETGEMTETRVSAGCVSGLFCEESCDAILEFDENCPAGDYGEQCFTMELVSVAEDRRVLAKMDMIYFRKLLAFYECDAISSGLADFWNTVWSSAGRPDIRICNELIAMALGEDFQEKLSSSTVYLDTERAQHMGESPGAPKHVTTLLRMTARLFESSYLIGHVTDLPKGLRFSELPGWKKLSSNSRWNVRLPEMYSD